MAILWVKVGYINL